MPTKDQIARELAHQHASLEGGLFRIFRVRGNNEREEDPIKLLEVNRNTIPSGVMPLQFDPAPDRGVLYSTVIIELTPEEFDEYEANRLRLPNGWDELQELLRR